MLELNKVYCMDCLEGLKHIDKNSIDLLVTDPPYFIDNLKKDLRSQTIRRSSKNNVFFNEFDHFESLKEYKLFMLSVLRAIRVVLKPKAQGFLFCSYHHFDWFIRLLKKEGFRFYKPLIWFKRDVMGVFPNQYGCNYEPILWFSKKAETESEKKDFKFKNFIGCSQRDVFEFYSTSVSARKEAGYHPTPKPVPLLRRLILNASCKNDVVLDAFMGSGSTAVASKQTERRFIGFEKKQEYVEICLKRLKQESLVNLTSFMEVKNGENL